MATGYFDPNKQASIDEQNAALALSAKEEEDLLLKQQMAMADSLRDQATSLENPGSNKIGGIAHVIAKGLKGYMGGKQTKEYMGRIPELGSERMGNRGVIASGMLGNPYRDPMGNYKPPEMEDKAPFMGGEEY